jgi:hypothetical protein
LQRQHQVTEVLSNVGFLKNKTADSIWPPAAFS